MSNTKEITPEQEALISKFTEPYMYATSMGFGMREVLSNPSKYGLSTPVTDVIDFMGETDYNVFTNGKAVPIKGLVSWQNRREACMAKFAAAHKHSVTPVMSEERRILQEILTALSDADYIRIHRKSDMHKRIQELLYPTAQHKQHTEK